MKTTSFDDFMKAVDWNDLEVNEQEALFDAIESNTAYEHNIFQLLPANNSAENMVLEYIVTGDKLILTPKAKSYFKRWLEYRFTNKEDGLAYLEWKKQIEKED